MIIIFFKFQLKFIIKYHFIHYVGLNQSRFFKKVFSKFKILKFFHHSNQYINYLFHLI